MGTREEHAKKDGDERWGMGKMGRGEERMGNSVTARGQVIQWVPRELCRRIISAALIYC